MTINRWGAVVIVGVFACVSAGCRNQKLTDFIRQRFIGPPAAQRVDMMMKSPDADVRREMVASFAREDYGRQEPFLQAYAALLKHDADPRVRAAAARALGGAGAMAYWDTLVGALEDRSEIVRWDVAVEMDRMMVVAGNARAAVAEAGDKAVGPLQRHAVEDTSMDVRAACAWALRRYRRPEAVKTLIACLLDREFSVRERAHGALVEMLGRDEGYAAHAWRSAVEGGITWGPPPARPEEPRRWWWPFGKSRAAPAASPAAEQPPPPAAPAKSKKAWWWPFGKRSSEAPATPAAAEQPPPPAAPAKPKRAWWWPFGKRSSEAPATPSPGAAGS